MPTDADFLDAVCKEPEDDGLRLIYADWLDEQGDPRGEFVRVQVELARLPQDDPRRPDLQRREEELLAAHRDAWLSALPKFDGVTWGFHRGLVCEAAAGYAAFRAHADALFRAAPVHRVHFHRVTAAQASELAASPHLARLTGLNFSGWAAAAQGLAATLQLARAVVLGLFGRAGDAVSQALTTMPHLASFFRLFVGSGIGPDGARALAASPHLVRLTELNLQGNAVGDAGALALAAAPWLARLTDLDLSVNNVGDDGARALLAAPHPARLRRLDLRHNPFSEEMRDRLRQRFGGRVQV